MEQLTKDERCSSLVTPNDRMGVFHSHQCYKKAKVIRDGKPYCTVHDPEYIKAKREKQDKEWEEQRIKERAKWDFNTTAHKNCVAINPDNPMAVAENISNMYTTLETMLNDKALAHYLSTYDYKSMIDNVLKKVTEGKV